MKELIWDGSKSDNGQHRNSNMMFLWNANQDRDEAPIVTEALVPGPVGPCLWTPLALSSCNIETELELQPDEIGNFIEEAVELARPINLEVNSDDVQDRLDSHN
ncbi:hypothetical protein TNCV_4215811 [Trichonephila clavipes]|nr:hypothetical protein TNCV_4215811 [Trichonephila clavipes]